MINRKMDTKLIFAESFIELLKETSFSKITVQKIVDNCGFKRQTFYLHFQDKYDLSYWIYKQRNDIIVDCYLDTVPWQDILCKMLIDHLAHQKLITTILNYEGQNSLRECVHTYAYDTYFRVLKKRLGASAPSDDFMFALKLYCHGSAEMSSNWIMKGMRESPQYMAGGLVKSMTSDMRKYFF